MRDHWKYHPLVRELDLGDGRFNAYFGMSQRQFGDLLFTKMNTSFSLCLV